MCLCTVILCCMLFMEQKHIFSFLNIYFLQWSNEAYGVYALTL